MNVARASRKKVLPGSLVRFHAASRFREPLGIVPSTVTEFVSERRIAMVISVFTKVVRIGDEVLVVTNAGTVGYVLCSRLEVVS